MEAYRPLDNKTFDGLRVQAFKPPLIPGFLGGPVLLDPAFAQFRHKRFDHACDSFDEDASFEKYLEGEWVYIGPKYDHFGHIMSEMVHRIIPSKIFFPDIHNHLLVATFADNSGAGFDSLCRSYRAALEFCEVDPSSILILNQNTIVEHLSICEQGSNSWGYPQPWYLDVLRDFSTTRLDQIHGPRTSPAKVYVSKSKIPHGGTLLGERYLEELLGREGFFVFHPEKAPLSLQMDIYRKATQLVFAEGSALHGAELLGGKMLDRTFVLLRRMEARERLARVLGPRSQEFDTFLDTFFLGTVVVHSETRHPYFEYAVSLLDIDRLVAFFRNHQLARLEDISVARYFEVAEEDLRAYFSYHTHSGFADVDDWRIGELTLEFEKTRHRLLAGGQRISKSNGIGPAASGGANDDAATIEKHAWAAHRGKTWFDAAQRWEVYRERFPYSDAGFTLGSVALCALGRYAEAEKLIRLGLDRLPHHEELLEKHAWVAQRNQDWPEAERRWEKLKTLYPNNRAARGYLRITGCVDFLKSATILSGWAQYEIGDEALHIRVLLNGTLIGTGRTGEARPDGSCGFSITLSRPITMMDIRSNAVKVYAIDTDSHAHELPVWSKLLDEPARASSPSERPLA